jgi:hypothetical protein
VTETFKQVRPLSTLSVRALPSAVSFSLSRRAVQFRFLIPDTVFSKSAVFWPCRWSFCMGQVSQLAQYGACAVDWTTGARALVGRAICVCRLIQTCAPSVSGHQTLFLFQGLKRPRREADHLPLCNAEVINSLSCVYASSRVLILAHVHCSATSMFILTWLCTNFTSEILGFSLHGVAGCLRLCVGLVNMIPTSCLRTCHDCLLPYPYLVSTLLGSFSSAVQTVLSNLPVDITCLHL